MDRADQQKYIAADSAAPLIEVMSPASYRRFKKAGTTMDIHGKAAASLRLAPPLFVKSVVDSMRGAKKFSPPALAEALRRAGDIFARDELCGLSPEAYICLTVQITGLPALIVKNSLHMIACATEMAAQAGTLGIDPQGSAVADGAQSLHGCARWVRRGEILAVIAPGNGPGVHAIWPQAIALGYRVVLRPSEREPFTAQRLVAALIKAGLKDYVALIPTDHTGAEAMIAEADLALVYGGEDMVKRYAALPDILVQGPGRSKMMIGRDYPRELALSLVFESVTGLGGAACVCASSVLVESDADAFAHDFYNFAYEKFMDKDCRQHWAAQLSRTRFCWLQQLMAQSPDTLLRYPPHVINYNQTYSMMPIIHVADSVADPLFQQELPVAAVTFAPYNGSTDLSLLGPTLVMTVASANETLIASVHERAEIHNLYIGQVPTVWMHPAVPHDGYLADFLTVRRGYRKYIPDACLTNKPALPLALGPGAQLLFQKTD